MLLSDALMKLPKEETGASVVAAAPDVFPGTQFLKMQNVLNKTLVENIVQRMWNFCDLGEDWTVCNV